MDFQVLFKLRRIVMFLFVNGEESLCFCLLTVQKRYVSGSPCYYLNRYLYGYGFRCVQSMLLGRFWILVVSFPMFRIS